MGFAQNLKYLQEATKTSNYAVAARLNVSKSTVTNWRNGADPNQLTKEAIAEAFMITYDELVGDELPPVRGFNKQKKPAITTDDELFPGVSTLSEENKAKVRDYIALLLNSQRNA